MNSTSFINPKDFENLVKYFDGDTLAAQVWLDKYALKSEDGNPIEKLPSDMHMRMAHALAKAELKYSLPSKRIRKRLSDYGKTRFLDYYGVEGFYRLFDKFKYIVPGGSMMANLGNPAYGSTSNCFFIALENDSMESIFKVGAQLASIFKYRGGCGINISKLRPAGAYVHNSAKSSSGSVSFTPLFSEIARVVGQDGRRAAMMISISSNHPDVLDFIKIKRNLNMVTGANISVQMTDAFLFAVKHEKDYFLRWHPVLGTDFDLNKLHLSHTRLKDMHLPYNKLVLLSDEGVYIKRINAKEVYTELVKSAHLSAEPGILFWDTTLNYSLSSYYPRYREEGTNPCQPEWATVLTPTGICTFKDVNVGDLIWSSEGWTTIIKKECSGVKDVYNYRTTAGIFSGTDTHKIISRGTKIEIKDAETIDVLAGCISPIMELNSSDIMDGLVIGDGSVHTASNSLIYLCIGEQDQDYFSSDIKSLINKKRPGIKECAFEIQTTIVPGELPKTYERRIPRRFIEGNSQKVRGFLKGLYSANGSVVNKRVTLKTASPYVRDEVQLMLSSVGIRSYYTTNKSKDTEFKNGIYTCKESYDINISTDREIFYHTIGFIQKYKMDALKLSIGKISPLDKTHPIVDIEWNSKEPVYNITVDNESHTYWTGGLNVANCGEIPLADKDACRLFAINLGGSDITAALLYKLAYDQVVIADLSIDVEDERIQRILNKIGNKSSIEYQLWKSIQQTAKDGRRIGCGITGLFEEIANQLRRNPGLTQDQILEHIKTIFQIKMEAELDATIDLAILKGAFKGYNKKESSYMLDHIKDTFPMQYKRMLKYGRRNVSFSTIAPTGTISVLTGTTSGIEPLFAPYYIRRRKVNNASEKADSVDVDGEKFTNHYVVHRGLVKYAKSKGIDTSDPNINWENIFNNSPYKDYVASKIPIDIRLKIQSIAQEYTTHSISSTLNLPENTSIEDINTIFEKAHSYNLKGVTVYREGSRNGILVTQDTPNKVKFPQYDSPKRPNSLEGELHITKAQGDTYAIIIGLLDNKPYEIFAALSQQYKPQKGRIIKVKRGVYKWIGNDGSIIENLNTLSEFSTERALTLLVSMLLRHGAKIPFVVNVVKKTDSNIISFNSAICRILSKYIQKGETGEVCPECGEKLIRESGCTKCTNCSYSICMIVYETKN